MSSPSLVAKAGRRLRRARRALRARRRPHVASAPSRRTVVERGSDRPDVAFVIVIDGLRPDSIDPDHAPNLHRLRASGVNFLDAHAVFPTGTRVNAAAIATGTYPGSNGLMGNSLYLPELGAGRSWSTQRVEDVLRAQQALEGRLLLTDSLGEILARHGMTLAVVSSASTGSSLLLNPKALEGIGVSVNGAFEPGVRVAYPDDVNREVLSRFGPAPPKAGHARPRDALVDWTQRVLMEYVVPERAPDVVIDWIAEPDHTQHAFGVGSPEALEAIGNVDRNVGYVLSRLEDLGLAARTNLFVVSDHGVTRYARAIDVDQMLIEASLKARRGSDDVVVAANGPCAQLYVNGRDPDRIEEIVAFLQRQEWSGAIFTPLARPPGGNGSVAPSRPGADGSVSSFGWAEGTLSLDLVHLFNPERSCDVLLTFPWGSERNEFGVPGAEVTTAVEGKRALHSGHGGASSWATRSTLIASGPAFKNGTSTAAPVGNVDIVPTILSLVGIDPLQGMGGRVLSEALKGGPDEGMVETTTRTFTTATADGGYRAAAQVSEVLGHRYLDKAWRLGAELDAAAEVIRSPAANLPLPGTSR